MDSIRYYIEDLFSNNEYISYIITTSTLLEGVNLPADRMFLLSNSKGKGNLNRSDFKNLIGRINRFKYIFEDKKEDLAGLESKIYIINNKYFNENANANVKEFIRNVMNVLCKEKDLVENVMLNSVHIDDHNKKVFQEMK